MPSKKVTFQIDAQDNASSKFKALENQTLKLQKATNSQASSLKNTSSSALSLGNIFNALAFGAVAKLTKTMIENASSMEQNRIAFETMLGSAEQAAILLSRLSEFARKTPFDLPQLVEGTKKLLAYGTAANDIIPTMNALGNIAAGVGTDKMPQLVLAFGQVQTATKLTGMELRQFTEAGVPLLDALAKQSGKSAAQIKSDMEGGAAPSFEEVRKAIFSMSEDGGKFFNLMQKQSQTLGGQLSNMKDNFFRLGNAVVGVSETGDIIEGSFFDVIRKSVFDVNDSLDSNYKTITTWGSAIINSFMALGRTLANAVTMIAKIITAPIVMAVGGVRDAIETIRQWLSGDFTVSLDNLGASWDTITEGIKEDGTDMAAAWLDASGAVDVASQGSIQSMGELKGASKKLSEDVSKDTQKMADKMESFAKKIKDAKNDIKDLTKEYKESRKELEKEYKDNVSSSQSGLATNIAEILYEKEQKLTELKSDLKEADTDATKEELNTQIAAIEDFISQHTYDYKTYANAIADYKKYMALDEIEKLKYNNKIELAELKSKYEEDLKELKDNYKKKKEALKDHLDDIKDELKKFLKSSTVKSASKLFDWNLGSLEGRASGGSVSGNTPYVVGEQGPELFVPNSSGTIIPNNQMGSNFTFNFQGAMISDKGQLITEIKQAINRELELSRYGIG